MTGVRVRTREAAAVEAAQGRAEPAIDLPELDLSGNTQLQRVLVETGMGGLQIPFTRAEDPLAEAIRRMQRQRRHAVIVSFAGDDYRLSMNRSVMDARTEGVERCIDLRRFPNTRVALFPFRPAPGTLDFSQLSPQWFDRFATDYGLLFEPGAIDQSAYLLTRTDELAQAILDAQEICQCLKKHPYKQPPPVNGTLCEHDNTQIVCT